MTEQENDDSCCPRIKLVLRFLSLSRVRIIFAGDDVTDEDAINALKGMAMTFRIVSNQVRIFDTSYQR